MELVSSGLAKKILILLSYSVFVLLLISAFYMIERNLNWKFGYEAKVRETIRGMVTRECLNDE